MDKLQFIREEQIYTNKNGEKHVKGSRLHIKDKDVSIKEYNDGNQAAVKFTLGDHDSIFDMLTNRKQLLLHEMLTNLNKKNDEDSDSDSDSDVDLDSDLDSDLDLHHQAKKQTKKSQVGVKNRLKHGKAKAKAKEKAKGDVSKKANKKASKKANTDTRKKKYVNQKRAKSY